MVANTGSQLFVGTLLVGETEPWETDHTGTASTKAQWTRQDMTAGATEHTMCGVVIPGGGGGWYPDTPCV
jgi:hypothetical protein